MMFSKLQLLSAPISINCVVARLDLPPACDTRLRGKKFIDLIAVRDQFVLDDRARANHTHPFCQDENARQDGEFAQVERIASNFDGAFRAAWDALENRNST